MHKNKSKNTQRYIKLSSRLFAVLLVSMLVNCGFADNNTIAYVQSNMSHSTTITGIIINNITLISGIGFIVSAFYKLHAHKNNPQQVPLTQAISLLVIGGVLTVFPHVVTGVVKASFGPTQIAGTNTSNGDVSQDPAVQLINGGSLQN